MELVFQPSVTRDWAIKLLIFPQCADGITSFLNLTSILIPERIFILKTGRSAEPHEGPSWLLLLCGLAGTAPTKAFIRTTFTNLSSESIRLSGSPSEEVRSTLARLLVPSSTLSGVFLRSLGAEENTFSPSLCSCADSLLRAKLLRALLSPGSQSLRPASASSSSVLSPGTVTSAPGSRTGDMLSPGSTAAARPPLPSIPAGFSLLSPGSWLRSGTARLSSPVSAVSLLLCGPEVDWESGSAPSLVICAILVLCLGGGSPVKLSRSRTVLLRFNIQHSRGLRWRQSPAWGELVYCAHITLWTKICTGLMFSITSGLTFSV